MRKEVSSMEFGALFFTLSLFILKFTDFLKFVRAKDWANVKTQLTVWVVAIAAVYGESELEVAHWLEALAVLEKIGLGLLAGSTASGIFDGKRAIDQGDSAKTPQLFNR
jgi:hypothetical protein